MSHESSHDDDDGSAHSIPLSLSASTPYLHANSADSMLPHHDDVLPHPHHADLPNIAEAYNAPADVQERAAKIQAGLQSADAYKVLLLVELSTVIPRIRTTAYATCSVQSAFNLLFNMQVLTSHRDSCRAWFRLYEQTHL
jgi:hypothetical protein